LELNSTYFGQFLCPSSGFFTVHTAMDQDGTSSVLIHCCVYSEKLLMMGRGTIRNV